MFAGMRAAAGKNAPAAEALRALAQRERLSLQIVEIDVTDDASVERAIAESIETTGRLDVVVNNAGLSYSSPLEAFTLEQVCQQFETNVFSVLRVSRAVLPQMRKQGSGLLLQMGSIVGRLAFPFLGLYGATKFALEGLTEYYRYELAPFGIEAAILETGTFPITSASVFATEMASCWFKRGGKARPGPADSPHASLRDMEFEMVEKAEVS